MNISYAFRDLGKQRTRTILGIIGISVSIFLLTVVGMLGDSIAYAYVDYASQEEGKIDFELRGGYIDYAGVESEITADTDLNNILGDFLPRSDRGSYNQYVRQVKNYANNKTSRVYSIGVDIQKEQAAYQGAFTHVNGTVFSGTLSPDECLITIDVAQDTGIVEGESITFQDLRYLTADRQVLDWMNETNYTVKAIVNHNFKFPYSQRQAIIIDIVHYNYYWSVSHKQSCEYLVINFKEPERYYSTKNIEGTILKIRRVGEDVQNVIGFYNEYYGQSNTLYSLYMPRTGILEYEQYINAGLSIILLFVSILGMIISGVLINGILSTSIEEKIREFGVFRVLGAHRGLPIRITLAQAAILSAIGTGVGLGLGFVTVKYGLLKLISNLVDFAISTPSAVLSVETILIATGVGVGVSMIVGLAPAVKASKMSILAAINPYRQESAGTRMVKEGSINVKFVIVGAVISAIASFVLYAVPEIILTLDIGLIVTVLVILLSTFLVGATLVGLGFLPAVQNVIRRVFTAVSRKIKEIVRISLIRYNRRNVTTVIMFSISFSFITLVSTVLRTQSAQIVGEIRSSNGSDLVIDSRSNFISGKYNPESGADLPDYDFATEIMTYSGVGKTSALLATTRELDIIRGSDHSITVSDRIKYKTSSTHGIGIDENYLDTVYNEFIIFSSGKKQKAFMDLFNGSNTVIISTSIAATINLDLYDRILLTFEWGENNERDVQEFIICGVVDSLSGIPSVQKSESSGLFGGGGDPAIILSQDNFKNYFQLPSGNYYTSKIFLKLTQDYQNTKASSSLEQKIIEDYEDDYIMDLDNSFSQGQFEQMIFGYVEALFLLILSFAVIISLFGLTSSAYSTILERTREVGVIETLGLKKPNVASMFILESEIIMFSAAINGAIVGTILTAIFYWQLDSFSSFPIMSVYSVPWSTLLIELAVAGIACLIGMKLLVRRVQKMELIDIFRKTM
ncbi:FtsX-like permease family protein [Candidatus Bathyarchaeota archaeon]|nr:FtsX-like permease family protein [Candidatus Bathyarchaeota archaeon]